MVEDTIAAIATPIGSGAISIIRLSGTAAIPVADRLFRGSRKLAEAGTHTIHHGYIIDPITDRPIEEVLISVMRKPKTFTREDVVEINCHGGLLSVNRVLETILKQNVRLAEPGEFTKRAFLNGRIDLSQAEAVMDLIRAKSDRAMNMAINQMGGGLSHKIRELRSELLDLLAAVEVNIDYPEYDDAEVITGKRLCRQAQEVRDKIELLLKTARQGQILRDGIATAIIGRPNVGKSSLLNYFSHENKAIVTDVPGTTRDTIEEYVTINGIPLKLIDTAGIRATEDAIEKIGVERSKRALKTADLVLLLVDYHQALKAADRQLIEAVSGIPAFIVINKTDQSCMISMDQLKESAGKTPIVRISVRKGTGLNKLEQAISDLFFSNGIERNEENYISNPRQIALLSKASESLKEAIDAAETGIPVDMAQIDVRRSWDILGEITGDTASDQLINQLFSKFCLGK